MEQMKMTIEIAAYQRNLELKNNEYQKSLETLLKIRTQEKNEIMDMYQILIDNSLMGLTIMQDERFVFANIRTAEIFGYTLDEFLTFSIHDIIGLLHPEDQQKVLTLSQDRLNGRIIPRGIQIRIINKEGNICWLETRVKTILFKGKPAIHQTFLDITEYQTN